MKFTDELERLLAVGSDFTIRGLLQDNAPALLELVRAAEELLDNHPCDGTWPGCSGCIAVTKTRAALSRLEPK